MIISGPEEIAGYWHIAPLNDRDYQQIKEGKLFDSDITINRIIPMDLAGQYNVYLSQACLLPALRARPGDVLLLFRTLFDVLEELSEVGIFIKEITANAVTGHGIGLAERLEMNFLGSDGFDGSIYSVPIERILRARIGNRFPELRDRYASEGLYTPGRPRRKQSASAVSIVARAVGLNVT
jgi:hypothetical protein